MSHNMNYNVSKNIFRNGIVKQKAINSTRISYRGGIRL